LPESLPIRVSLCVGEMPSEVGLFLLDKQKKSGKNIKTKEH